MGIFRFRAIVTILSLLGVHVAGFVAMLLLLQSVQESVTDLDASGGTGISDLLSNLSVTPSLRCSSCWL